MPSTWFYEFSKKTDGSGKSINQPYRVELHNKSIFTITGLYETSKLDDGTTVQSATIITCPSQESLNTIHERQPVIISETDRETWLFKSTELEKAEKLLQPEKELIITKIDRSFNKAFGDVVTEEMVGW